jgi:hypothetical protein
VLWINKKFMKKLYTLLALVITIITFAQAPQGFNYQATVRNSAGALIVNQNVNFKFNIMLNSATSLPVFSETHMAPTDDLGQVNLVIGTGTATVGTFSTINWGTGNYYLGIELNTGSGYVAMGTTQLLSVPYALYANSSGNAQAATPNLADVLAVNNGANNLQIKNLADPIDAQDATNKVYVDAIVPNGILPGDILMWNGTDWDLSSNLLPKINTTQASSITSNSCQVGGEIISIGGSNIIRKGICYSEQIFPTVADTRVYNTSTNNTFSLSITLAPGMTYYVRSFAENSFGITYGQEITLTTLIAQPPSLTTTPVTSISNISAISGGNITNDGGGVITSRGIVWATTANPTTTSYIGITTDGTSIGTFSSNLTGLTPFTLYYVRAYATNSFGTAYGNEISFVTTGVGIITGAISSNITYPYGNYTLNGIVTIESGAVVTFEAGSTITADVTNGVDALVVKNGGKLIMNGTAAQPIVLTESSAVPGSWGGIIMYGDAPINGSGGVTNYVSEDGLNLVYGGTNSAHNGGTLRYVRVEYAGKKITDGTSEMNGFSFYSVGSGTVLENLVAYKGADDGFQFYGGTVSALNLISYGNFDDSFAWQDGWQGQLSLNWYAYQEGTGNFGMEIECNNNNNAFWPKVSNITLKRSAGTVTEGGSSAAQYDAIQFKKEGNGEFSNILISGYTTSGATAVRIQDAITNTNQVNGGKIKILNVKIMDAATTNYAGIGSAFTVAFGAANFTNSTSATGAILTNGAWSTVNGVSLLQ